QKDSLNYEGQSEFKYIPVDQEAALNMGAVANVMVQPKLMDFRTTDIRFDSYGGISGWDDVREFEIKVNKTRDMKVKVEITPNIDTIFFDLKEFGDFDNYKKVDKQSVQFDLELNPQTERKFGYILTTRHGTREH
ncbi:MAG: hypothetical protein GX811_13640, partial [Lentisphaerae bacterium]|nr:hypothetical protein [Lentisphaerota bacterium]